MENRYPLFAGGRILKKESLWDLRDYAYESWQLYYADYTDGIIKGCRVRVEGTDLIIGKGILKCLEIIYLIHEETRITFSAENKLLVLKAVFQKKESNLDHLIYELKFFLDSDQERQENQIELCRFHLRTGAVLRDNYKNFSDMGTQYDTVNLFYATVAGRRIERLHPEVLLRFAEEMQSHERKEDVDRAFCYEIVSNAGEVEIALVKAYLEDKGLGVEFHDKEKMFRNLEAILYKGGARTYRSERKNLIYVE